MWLFMYQGAFRVDRRVLDWKRWRISMLELEVVPIGECHKSRWGWVLLCIGRVCILLIVLVFSGVASAFVSLLLWAAFFCIDVLCPCQPSIEMHAQEFHFICLAMAAVVRLLITTCFLEPNCGHSAAGVSLVITEVKRCLCAGLFWNPCEVMTVAEMRGIVIFQRNLVTFSSSANM
jgi:hypothetical protein